MKDQGGDPEFGRYLLAVAAFFPRGNLNVVIRAFAVRTPQGWEVMPGGYARIGRTEDPTALAMQSGGSVADVWVVARKPVKPDSLTHTGGAPFVFRVRDGRAERVPIQVHGVAGQQVVVDGALRADDRVIVAGHAALLDGDAVRIVAPASPAER